MGAYALGGTSGSNNVGLGYLAVNSLDTGSNNIGLGYSAVSNLTTGSNNVSLGYLAGNNLTTGSNNIIIGYNINATSSSATGSLNIGNLLFGTGVDGTGSTLSSGNIGVSTTTPWGKLSVTQTGTADAPAFIVEDSASPDTTPFIIDQTGAVGIGTSTPAAALDVNGLIRVYQTATTTCAASIEGAIFYNSENNHFWGCDGANWNKLDN